MNVIKNNCFSMKINIKYLLLQCKAVEVKTDN